MKRFFAEIESGAKVIALSEDDAKHITKVLRLGLGTQITVCDGNGTDCMCELTRVDKTVEATILHAAPCLAEPKTKVTLFQALPKADKMELLIQKCVEIGVFAIVPVITERTVVKISGKENTKLARWQKIAESAAKQSGRGVIPQIRKIVNFCQSLELAAGFGNRTAAHTVKPDSSLKAYLQGKTGGETALFIGPEGGFSDDEVAAMRNSGISLVSLGKRILRTETAGMAALTAILYELGDMQ